LDTINRSIGKNKDYRHNTKSRPRNHKGKQAQATGACNIKLDTGLQQPSRNTNNNTTDKSKHINHIPQILLINVSYLLHVRTKLLDTSSRKTVVQKHSSPPHKAHNLPGSGRGGSKNLEQKQQLCNLTQYITAKNNSPANTLYANILCTCHMKTLQELQWVMATSGSRRVARSLMTNEDEFMDIDASPGSTHKRTTGATKEAVENGSKKKSKGVEELHITIFEIPSRRYWLGFNYMEQLAKEAGIPECTNDGSIEDLVAKGYMRTEAMELERTIVSYPRVPQVLYPSVRSDKGVGQYYNLTQLPFEVETNPDTGLSLDFHITIYFEQPKHPFEHDEILSKAQNMFKQMGIPLSTGILHPITVFYKHTKQKEDPRIWAGIIKIHLQKPEIHAINLLRGTRPFILQLDQGNSYLGKVAKGYDAVARNNLLSIKFESPNLQEVTAHELFMTVLADSFERNLEYEITGVQKGIANTFA
jgi:hypothetical protein